MHVRQFTVEMRPGGVLPIPLRSTFTVNSTLLLKSRHIFTNKYMIKVGIFTQVKENLTTKYYES